MTWIESLDRRVQLHHVSTLSVCGRIDTSPISFSEGDLFINQRFLTQYEKSKFDAECLIHTWSRAGWPAFIYRMGHIAADYRSGAFQRNVADNRVYQMIRDYVLTGLARSRPQTKIAFSYVDTVAEAIVATALSPGAVAGVYHVETPHEVGHDEVIDWLRRLGYAIKTDTDPGAAASWAEFHDRGVTIDRRVTLSALECFGIQFGAPTFEWWARAMAWAVRVGFLPPPGNPPADTKQARNCH